MNGAKNKGEAGVRRQTVVAVMAAIALCLPFAAWPGSTRPIRIQRRRRIIRLRARRADAADAPAIAESESTEAAILESVSESGRRRTYQPYRAPGNGQPQFQRTPQNPYAPQAGARGPSATPQYNAPGYGRQPYPGTRAAALCAPGAPWRVAQHQSQYAVAAAATVVAQ